MPRPPKPTQLKIIGGNAGHRQLNKQEPDAEYLANLAAPTHLTAEAAAVWDELAPPLARSKLLTVLDGIALEMACNAIATYRLASTKAVSNPLAKSAETGAVALSPWGIVQAMTRKQAFEILKEFGMTPAARSRVMIQPQSDMFASDTLGEFARRRPGAA